MIGRGVRCYFFELYSGHLVGPRDRLNVDSIETEKSDEKEN